MDFLEEEEAIHGQAFGLEDLRKKYGAYLPHWTADGAIYHVVFRLHDSLPRRVLREIEEERRYLLLAPNLTEVDRKRLHYLLSDKVEQSLDQGAGECLMKNPVVANSVAEAIKYFDGSKFRSYAWAVMPNHVHLVAQPSAPFTIPKIVHNLKSYTSHSINKVLNREGKVWKREYFDRLIRNEKSLFRTVEYVVTNSDNAHLKDGIWTSETFGGTYRRRLADDFEMDEGSHRRDGDGTLFQDAKLTLMNHRILGVSLTTLKWRMASIAETAMVR